MVVVVVVTGEAGGNFSKGIEYVQEIPSYLLNIMLFIEVSNLWAVHNL